MVDLANKILDEHSVLVYALAAFPYVALFALFALGWKHGGRLTYDKGAVRVDFEDEVVEVRNNALPDGGYQPKP